MSNDREYSKEFLDEVLINMTGEGNTMTPEGEEILKQAAESYQEGASAETVPEEHAPEFQLDPEKPLDNLSHQQIMQLLGQVKQVVSMFETSWKTHQYTYGVTEKNLQAIYDFNNEHRDPPPEGVDVNDDSYDRFNGLYKLTQDDIDKIFLPQHPINKGCDSVEQTNERIHEILSDFFHWRTSLKEYENINEAYVELMETEEEARIKKLQIIAEKNENPEEKEKQLKALHDYYANKYLDFLAEPLDDMSVERLVQAFSSGKKIEYWIDRSRRKLKQLGLSSKAIPELSQFESRFMDKKYHSQNNIFLLYFMYVSGYCDPYNKKDIRAMKTSHIVLTMDRFIRGKLKEEHCERIMENMIAFEEQFVGKLPVTQEVKEETPEESSLDVKSPIKMHNEELNACDEPIVEATGNSESKSSDHLTPVSETTSETN